MNEAPKMSYNETLGRPVFLNREAFYVCLSGVNDPTIFEQVEWEFDEHFEKHYKKQTGEEEVSQDAVSQFIGNLVGEADKNYKNINVNEGVDAFVVPPENPNISDHKEIRWFNTEKLEKIKQRYDKRQEINSYAKENSDIYSHHTDDGSLHIESSEDINPEQQLNDAMTEASDALTKELKTLEEYDEEKKKNLKK